MKALNMAVFFLLILSSISMAQDVTLDISGQCKEFNVTLKATDMPEGCYDVKIDITTPNGRVGQIFDPHEGWKSSYYYINGALCIEEGSASETFMLRSNTTEKLNFAAKMMFSSTVWESGYYEFEQDCPTEKPDNNPVVVLIALIVILVLLVAVTLYVKVWKK